MDEDWRQYEEPTTADWAREGLLRKEVSFQPILSTVAIVYKFEDLLSGLIFGAPVIPQLVPMRILIAGLPMWVYSVGGPDTM